MRGSFIAVQHQNRQFEEAYGERVSAPAVDFTTNFKMDNTPIPTRPYPFLNSHPLTAHINTDTLVEHDMLDEERMPVKLELSPEMLSLVVDNVNLAFEANKPKVDLQRLTDDKLTTLMRLLRPELVKDEIGVHVAASLLNENFLNDQMRRAKLAGIEMSDLADKERDIELPGVTLERVFAEDSREEWDAAREEAIDMLLAHIDPRFVNDVSVFAGREVAIDEDLDDTPEAEITGTIRLRQFGRGVLRKLTGVAA